MIPKGHSAKPRPRGHFQATKIDVGDAVWIVAHLLAIQSVGDS